MNNIKTTHPILLMVDLYYFYFYMVLKNIENTLRILFKLLKNEIDCNCL